MENKKTKEIIQWILLGLGAVLSAALAVIGLIVVLRNIGFSGDTMFGGLFFIISFVGAALVAAGAVPCFFCVRTIVRRIKRRR